LPKNTNITVDLLKKVYDAIKQDTSIDEPIKEEEGTTFHELLFNDDGNLDPYVIAKNKSLQNMLYKMLTCLNDTERDIIIRRFGLNGHEPETLESIGQDFSITRERVRQIEKRVIRQIKNYVINKKLNRRNNMTDPIKELHMRDSRFRYNMIGFIQIGTLQYFFHRIDIYYFTHTLQMGYILCPEIIHRCIL